MGEIKKMARTFYPRITKCIPASAPHEPGTEYKISIGDEEWGDGTFQSVVKVQMVYDGKVAGRMSPSYPIHSNDWEAVQTVIDELVGDDGVKSNIYYVPTILSKDSIMDQLNEIISLTEDRPSSEKMKYINTHTCFISYKMTGIFKYTFYHLIDDLKVLCDFKEAEGLEVCDEVIKVVEELDSDDDTFVETLISAVRVLIDGRV